MMSTAMVMVFAAACSSKNTPPATASETTATVAETTQQETTKAESTASAESLNTDEAKDSEESKADSAADQEEASMTGTISDIKDFMFTITFDGQDYGFSFDQNEKPQGLDSVKDGDTVMVTYTGTVNTVDAFTGKSTPTRMAQDKNLPVESKIFNHGGSNAFLFLCLKLCFFHFI